MQATFIEESKKSYSSNRSFKTATLEELQTGCLQRIAAATELMATEYQRLIEQRDRYYRWYEEEKTARYKLLRKYSALKGVVTKLRNEVKGNGQQ